MSGGNNGALQDERAAVGLQRFLNRIGITMTAHFHNRVLGGLLVVVVALLSAQPLYVVALTNAGNLALVHSRLPFADAGALSDAEVAYRTALAVAPAYLAAGVRRGLARTRLAEGDLLEALALDSEAGAPGNPLLNAALAEALWRQGHRDEALAYWRRTPDADLYVAKRGDWNLAHGDDIAALADYRLSWLISDRPARDKTTSLLNFCTLLRRAGDAPGAIAACLRSRESLDNGWQDLMLGLLQFDQRDYGGAERLFRQALATYPSIARGQLWLGLSLSGQGRLADAIAVFRQGMAVTPDDAWLNFELGRALATSGARSKEVRSYLETSLRLCGTGQDCNYSVEARQLLGRLP